MATTLFWTSIGIIIYAYLGYPLVLAIISIFYRKRAYFNPENTNFKISILISAYNEVANIEKKILNALRSNYPRKIKEIIVISDGSDDGTNEIVKKYEDHGVILHYYPGRIGKTACLNKTIPKTDSEILIFTDANSYLEENAIKRMVSYFNDQTIGFVTGYTRYKSDKESKGEDNPETISINLYTRLENITKILESKIGSCVGADGAIFAIRKELYSPLSSEDINDFVIPLKIIRKGRRGVFDVNSYCMEKSAGNSSGEFDRQVRITARTLRAIFKNSDLINPFRYPLFSFLLISHKVTKFYVPIFMALALLLNSIIAFINFPSLFYTLLLIIHLSVYIFAFSYNRFKFSRLTIIRTAGAYFNNFFMVNLAIAYGWIQYFQGNTFTAWKPKR